MPRTINPATHALRRDEFIEAGARLIQTRGYEQFSLDDLLADVGASKGAFYHYFDSKVGLLAAIVDRLVDSAMAVVGSVVDDDQLTALQKLHGYFRTIASIKAGQRDFLLQLMKVWYGDDNAIVRQKLRREQIKRVTPHLAKIIRQGVAEGSFTLSDPDQMARVVLALILDTGDEAGELFMRRQAGEIDFATVRRRLETYQQALERLLGAKPGRLDLIDESTLRLWFDQTPSVTHQAT
ncbi:MAG: TetR/AcrR family transcriptional regulator [Candidatus Limnocylindrales bacterium]